MMSISIHAPVKGATTVPIYIILNVVISIHAPVKGATLSTPKEFKPSIISIHAPVKGATSSSFGWIEVKTVFQSTPP